jgi:hypothetical protein
MKSNPYQKLKNPKRQTNEQKEKKSICYNKEGGREGVACSPSSLAAASVPPEAGVTEAAMP